MSSSASSSSSEEECKTPTLQPPVRNRQGKVMLISSRGIDSRHRHFLDDLKLLLWNSKKESKFDQKKNLFVLNEIAELSNCDSAIYFEVRKLQGVYLWISKCPGGPSARFYLENVNTLDELHMPGNGMKNTRMIVSFDEDGFAPKHMQVVRELLSQTFGSTSGQKVRPFIDRLAQFSVSDGRIWFRHYQILDAAESKKSDASEPVVESDGLFLREIGPRFALLPVCVFDGSFTGSVQWKNASFVPSSRSGVNIEKAIRQRKRTLEHQNSKDRKKTTLKLTDDLEGLFN